MYTLDVKGLNETTQNKTAIQLKWSYVSMFSSFKLECVWKHAIVGDYIDVKVMSTIAS